MKRTPLTLFAILLSVLFTVPGLAASLNDIFHGDTPAVTNNPSTVSKIMQIQGNIEKNELIVYDGAGNLKSAGVAPTNLVGVINAYTKAETDALLTSANPENYSAVSNAAMSALTGTNTSSTNMPRETVAHIGQSNAGSQQVVDTEIGYREPSSWASHTNAFAYVPRYLFGPTTSNEYNNIFLNPPRSIFQPYDGGQGLRGWGAWAPMAHILCEDNLRQSYQIVISDGATSIHDWEPGTGLYTNIAPALANAQDYWSDCPDYNAFVLYAHENDASTSTAAVVSYSNQLWQIINELWSDYGTNPVVLVGYGDRYNAPLNKAPGSDLFSIGTDKLLRDIADSSVHIGYVSALGLPYCSDDIHYTQPAMAKLGGRIAAQLKQLRATHITRKRIGADEVYAQNGTFGSLDVGSDIRVNGTALEDLMTDYAAAAPVSLDGLAFYLPLNGEEHSGVADNAIYVTDADGGIVARCHDDSNDAWPQSSIYGLQLTNTTADLSLSNASWTAAMWVKVDTNYSGTTFFFGLGDAHYSTNTGMGFLNDNTYWRYHTNSVAVKSSAYPSDASNGEWHHVCMSYDGTTGQYVLFRDGFNVAYNAAYNFPPVAHPDWDSPISIGWVNNTTGASEHYVDDFIFFNRALLPSELNAIYERGRGQFYRQPLENGKATVSLGGTARMRRDGDTVYFEDDSGRLTIDATDLDTLPVLQAIAQGIDDANLVWYSEFGIDGEGTDYAGVTNGVLASTATVTNGYMVVTNTAASAGLDIEGLGIDYSEPWTMLVDFQKDAANPSSDLTRIIEPFNGARLAYGAGGTGIIFNTGSDNVSFTSSFSTGVVYRLAVSYDGTSIRVYNAGELERTGNYSVAAGDGKVHLFKLHDNSLPRSTIGKMYRFALFRRQLSATEISAWAEGASIRGVGR